MITNCPHGSQERVSTTYLTAYALAHHCHPGKGRVPDSPKYLTDTGYCIDLVKDKSDGSWKIKKWVLKIVWTQRDPSVMQRNG